MINREEIEYRLIDRILLTKVGSNEYSKFSEITFNDKTKKFIEDIINTYEKALREKRLDLFKYSKENDEVLTNILNMFQDKNNKLYKDFSNSIGNIENFNNVIEDIFKLKSCKNINID